MRELAWPAVALVAVVLAFIAGLMALRRREGRFAPKEAFDVHVAEFKAFVDAVEKLASAQGEQLKRLDARTAAVMESRLPPGLRGAVPR